MRILTLKDPMMLDDRLHHPHDSIVVPDEVRGVPGTHADAYTIPYRVGCASGGYAALYRGGAIGDQFIAMGIARAMQHYEGDGRIDAYVPQRHLPLWEGFAGVRALPLAPTIATWKSYKGHVCLDDILSKTAHLDGNVYDYVYRSWGVDVDDEFKKPYAKLLEKDQHELATVGFDGAGPFLLYSISGSSLWKSYPTYEAGLFIKSFLKENKDWSVVAVGHDDPPLSITHNRLINLQGRLRNVRSLMHLAARCDMAVCPESAIMHMTAIFDAPTVGLYGPYGPEHTSKYYKYVKPLFPQNICPHAPCSVYEQPKDKCKDAVNAIQGDPKWCNVLKSIKPEDILAKTKEIQANLKKI